MKMLKPLFSIIAVGLLAFSQMGGCATTWQAATSGVNLSTTGQTGVVNDDAIVVNTEKALAISLDTFDTFLKLEYDNRAGLEKVSPSIHQFAEKLRRNGKNWIVSARNAKDAYKHNRTAENHANLVTAYKTLQTAIAESQKYIAANSGA